ADEIEGYVIELGTDGRLLALQLDELMGGLDPDRPLVIRDYLPSARRPRTLDEAVADLDRLSANELIDLGAAPKPLGYPPPVHALAAAVSPSGYRLLAKVPRLPSAVVERLVEHFGSLQRLLSASIDAPPAGEGVGALPGSGG